MNVVTLPTGSRPAWRDAAASSSGSRSVATTPRGAPAAS